jgi:hypothetical protein
MPMNVHGELNMFIANCGIPEISEELIVQGLILSISRSGETFSPTSYVDRLRKGEWVRSQVWLVAASLL